LFHLLIPLEQEYYVDVGTYVLSARYDYIQKIEKYMKAGVRCIEFCPYFKKKSAHINLLKQYSKEVIPYFKGL